VVRLALQQRDDTFELLVREAELAMERRFRDGAQGVILPAALDGPRPWCPAEAGHKHAERIMCRA
jgi:hypothetical protein